MQAINLGNINILKLLVDSGGDIHVRNNVSGPAPDDIIGKCKSIEKKYIIGLSSLFAHEYICISFQDAYNIVVWLNLTNRIPLITFLVLRAKTLTLAHCKMFLTHTPSVWA